MVSMIVVRSAGMALLRLMRASNGSPEIDAIGQDGGFQCMVWRSERVLGLLGGS